MDTKNVLADRASMAKQIRKRPQKRRAQSPATRHHVADWRVYRNLTQEQLAERIDRSRGLISQYESGETELTESSMHALAEALNCSVRELLEVDPFAEGRVIDAFDIFRRLDSDAARERAIGYMEGLLAERKA